MLVRIVAAVVACGLLAADAAAGQEQESPVASSRVADFIAEDEAARTAQARPPADPLPDLPEVSGLEALDPQTRDAALSAIREYYAYRLSGYEHRRRVFEWQLQSSKIIFWVVVLMVSAGIYFSGVQFHIALRAMRAAPPLPAAGEERGRTGLDTSLEAGTGGIKVSSPVLGVIILVISFLFFYMYLVHVHPIAEIM